MDLFDELTQEIDRLKVLLEVHKEMNAELRAALSWMDDHDPVLVEAAREKFGLNSSLTKDTRP